jgi:hypothetical protein
MLRRLLAIVRRGAGLDPWDALTALGGVLLFVGLWMIYSPAALLALGGALCAIGVWGAHVWNRGRS